MLEPGYEAGRAGLSLCSSCHLPPGPPAWHPMPPALRQLGKPPTDSLSSQETEKQSSCRASWDPAGVCGFLIRALRSLDHPARNSSWPQSRNAPSEGSQQHRTSELSKAPMAGTASLLTCPEGKGFLETSQIHSRIFHASLFGSASQCRINLSLLPG